MQIMAEQASQRGQRARWRALGALRWLLRLLFVEPVGRRARAEWLTALPERTLRDIGLRRPDVQAATLGLVPLAAVMQPYPSPQLCVGGRPGFRPVVVRLSKAA